MYFNSQFTHKIMVNFEIVMFFTAISQEQALLIFNLYVVNMSKPNDYVLTTYDPWLEVNLNNLDYDLANFDWTYKMSDDSRVYSHGQKLFEYIQHLINKCMKYAPERTRHVVEKHIEEVKKMYAYGYAQFNLGQ